MVTRESEEGEHVTEKDRLQWNKKEWLRQKK